MSNTRIRLFAIKGATVGGAGIGLWRNPRSLAPDYKRLDYLTGLARQLEAGHFDGVFFADAVGSLEVYQGRPDATLRDGIQVPSSDPTLALSAMAAVTERLDLVVTASTTYEQPYTLARKMTTLDHLTGGRIGWNIVNSALATGARNMGLAQLPAHDERYEIADEFMDVVYALWESSWADGAVRVDRQAGVYADPELIAPIRHRGRYYSVPDIAPSEPSIQRTPVLFQAGTSTRGAQFAGTHAEGVFISAYKPALARQQAQRVRDGLRAAGRASTGIVFLAYATVIAAATDAEAQAIYEREYRRYISPEGALGRYSALLDIDLSALDPDEPLPRDSSGGIQGLVDVFTRMDPDRVWTPREIGEYVAMGGASPVIVGSPSTCADELERWIDEAQVDGFNIADPLPGITLPAFIEHVVPELQRRGRVWSQHPGGAFRQSLLGHSSPLVPDDHPAAAFAARRRR